MNDQEDKNLPLYASEDHVDPNAPLNNDPRPGPRQAPDAPADAPPVKPPLASLDDAGEYGDRVAEERGAALDAKEEAMKARQEGEKEALAKRHEREVGALGAERERLGKEVEAIKLYWDMWRRQKDEIAYAGPSEQGAMRTRHADEHADLVRQTGFEVEPPLVGQSTRSGYSVPLPGHPWVRRAAVVV